MFEEKALKIRLCFEMASWLRNLPEGGRFSERDKRNPEFLVLDPTFSPFNRRQEKQPRGGEDTV